MAGSQKGGEDGSQRGWGQGELSRESSEKNYYYLGCDPFLDGVQPCERRAQFYNLYHDFCGNK